MFVRKLLRELPAEGQTTFLDSLTPEEAHTFESAVATQWVPIEHATRFFELIAPLAFPGKPNALRHVGAALADHDLHGVYRYLIRVATVPFFLKQTARLWKTYHRYGSARTEQVQPGEAVFSIEGYPELPERFRECLCGWLVRALEICGARGVLVVKDDSDPNAWKLRTRWR